MSRKAYVSRKTAIFAISRRLTQGVSEKPKEKELPYAICCNQSRFLCRYTAARVYLPTPADRNGVPPGRDGKCARTAHPEKYPRPGRFLERDCSPSYRAAYSLPDSKRCHRRSCESRRGC